MATHPNSPPAAGRKFYPFGMLPDGEGIGPLAAVARALSAFNREQLGSAVEVMIALMDVADGDPEAEIEDPAGETVPVIDDPQVPPEDNEDDTDLEELGLEDSFVEHPSDGPGCPIADVDLCPAGDDNIVGEYDGRPGDGEDTEWAYAEWQSLPAAARRSGRVDGRSADAWLREVHEDAEEDDGDEDDSDTEPNGDEKDFSHAEDEPIALNAMVAGGAGCPISDNDGHPLQDHVPMLPVYTAEHNVFTDQRTYLGHSNLMSSFRTNGGEVRSADTGSLFVSHVGGGDRKPGVPV